MPIAGNDVCTLCGGTGWKASEAGRVTRCDCKTGDRMPRLFAAANFPSRYADCEFAHFHTGDRSSSIGMARIIAEAFVRDYDGMNKQGLLLVGPSGVGKTHLAVAILKELIRQKGVPCLFSDYRGLLKQIQNSYNPAVQATELELLAPVMNTNVVALDDLGAVRPTEWVLDTVSVIVNHRYNNHLTTIITTNYPDGPAYESEERSSTKFGGRKPQTIGDRIGDRMRSRLHEMCKLVIVEGTDYRQRSLKSLDRV